MAFLPINMFTSCGKDLLYDEDALLHAIKEEENLSADPRKCDAIIASDKMLLIAVSGDAVQSYKYYVAEFSAEKGDAYRFIQSVLLSKIAQQVYLCKWQDGYVVICGNEQVSTFEATIQFNEGKREHVSAQVNSFPWVYYLEVNNEHAGYEIEYHFKDKEGENIN